MKCLYAAKRQADQRLVDRMSSHVRFSHKYTINLLLMYMQGLVLYLGRKNLPNVFCLNDNGLCFVCLYYTISKALLMRRLICTQLKPACILCFNFDDNKDHSVQWAAEGGGGRGQRQRRAVVGGGGGIESDVITYKNSVRRGRNFIIKQK